MKQDCLELINEMNSHVGECQRTHGKIAQWLRVSAALPEVWCSAPRSFAWQLTTTGKIAARDLMPSADFQRHTHICKHTLHTRK